MAQISPRIIEITEKIGLAGYFDFGPRQSSPHRVAASTFFSDTTMLSESVFNNRGRFKKRRGGPSNTERLSSFAIAVDGPLTKRHGNLGYHDGLSYQRGGERNPEDEIGIAVAAYGGIPITDDTTLEACLEAVHQSGAAAINQDRLFLTAGAALLRGPWTLAVAYSRRSTDPHTKSASGLARNDNLAQLSLAYGFANGVSAEIGYRYSEVGNANQHTVGLLLSFGLDFSWP